MAYDDNRTGNGTRGRNTRLASLALSLSITLHFTWAGLCLLQAHFFPSDSGMRSGAHPGPILVDFRCPGTAPVPQITPSIGGGQATAHVNVKTATLAIPIPVPVAVDLPGDIFTQSAGPVIEGGFGDGTDADAPGEIVAPDTAEPSPDTAILVEQEPMPVRKVVPEYPELARRLGVEGTVWMKILIDREGRPKKAIVVKSDNSLLDESARTAALEWRFTPAMMTSGPVMVWASIPFRFALDRQR